MTFDQLIHHTAKECAGKSAMTLAEKVREAVREYALSRQALPSWVPEQFEGDWSRELGPSGGCSAERTDTAPSPQFQHTRRAA